MLSLCICAGGSTAWISSEWLFRLHGKLGGALQTYAAERHEEHKNTEHIDEANKHFILQFWLHLKGCWLLIDTSVSPKISQAVEMYIL